MDKKIETLMHQLMTDKKFAIQARQAMMYGHTKGKMSLERFAKFKQLSHLRNASPLELYSLLCLFYETTQDKTYNPVNFFTQEELQEFAFATRLAHSVKFKPLILGRDEYWFMVEWGRLIPVFDNAERSNADLHMYNCRQRSLNLRRQLTAKVISGDYFPNGIWVNVPKEKYLISQHNGEIYVPSQIGQCAFIVDEEMIHLVFRDDTASRRGLNDILKHRLVPVRITNLPSEALREVLSLRKMEHEAFNNLSSRLSE